MERSEVVVLSLQGLYDRMVHFVPTLIVAILILILGWIIGVGLGRVAQRILEAVKVDSLANSLGMDRLAARMGRKLSVASFGYWLVKWFFIISAFVAATEIFGLTQISSFLYNQVIPYMGSVVVAIAILLIGVVVANFLQNVVRHSLQAGGLHTSDTLSMITKWAILVFAFMAALSELRVAEVFIHDLFRAIIIMVAVAGGIAFGLGGRDHAKKILDAVERDMTGK